MTSYPRSAYKNPFPIGTNRNNARERGWGPGWPSCQTNKMKTVTVKEDDGTVILRITVREEVAPMVASLLEATDELYNIKPTSTGAYNCRAIRGTNSPSNHSWGLAVDINWNDNPMSSTFHSEIPPAVVAMWNSCGWYWGGFYQNRPDTMHFEYIGRPSDVAKHTAKAKNYADPAAPKPPVVDGVNKPPATNLVVALATILKAAKTDPKSVTGKPPLGSKEMVMVVEKALDKEGLLATEYVNGLFGSKTVEAYRKLQLKYGYTGKDADGIPGWASLQRLGKAHGFEVIR